MAVNKGEIGIYGVLRRDGGDGILVKTDQIKDANLNKTQEQLNQEVVNNITNKVDKVEGKSLVSDTDITKLSELPSNSDLNNKLDDKLSKLSVEDTVTKNSNNPVSSAAISTYVDNTVTTIENKVTEGWWLPIKEGKGSRSVIEGMASSASGKASHAEGVSSEAIGDYSHAEQSGTAIGTGSHAEGVSYAKGYLSHVEGRSIASGRYSHAQGCNNYDDASFIDMVGVCPENFSDNTNASVIYVGRTSNGDINRKDPKNGYQYLINIGGYQGKTIKEGMKSVQEVISELETNLTNKVDRVDGKQLSTNDYTTVDKNKVAESINESTANTLINTAIGKLTKVSVGLDNVDNTADANKEVLSATKLKTAHTFWGQSFDGTASISGNLIDVTEVYLTDGSKYAEPCTEDDIKALFA